MVYEKKEEEEEDKNEKREENMKLGGGCVGLRGIERG